MNVHGQYMARIPAAHFSLKPRKSQANARLYKTVFENASYGIVVTDREGRIISANTAILKMLGYQGNDVLHENVALLSKEIWVTPENLDRFFMLVTDRGVVEGFETRFRRRDGTTFGVALSVRTIDDPFEPDLRHITYVEDIEAKGILKRDLLNREAALEKAQGMARLGHIISREDGQFESWSSSIPGLAGLEPDAVPHNTRDWMNRLVLPEDRQAFRAFATGCLTTEQPRSVEYRIRNALGSTVYISQTIVPMSSFDRSLPPRWFSILQDVSELRQSEERLRRLNRVHAVLSGVGSAIVRFQELPALFSEVCRIALVEGEFTAAWIGELDTRSKEGRVTASSGLAPECLREIAFSGDAEAALAGRVASRALITGNAQVHNSIEAELADSPLATMLLTHGHRSLAALPIWVSGQPRAVIMLHSDEVDLFDDEEVRLLSLLARDLSFAIDCIDKSHRLDDLSTCDSVTGLPNIAAFHNNVAQSLAGCPMDSHVVVALLDLEDFTSINESFGRNAGDDLLRDVSLRLQRSLKKAAVVARVGADTFAILTTEFRSGSLNDLASAVRAALSEPFSIAGRPLYVSAQLGLVGSESKNADASALCRHAELALKTAKADNETMVIYRPDIPIKISERAALEAELRLAEKRQEFRLHYQPLVELEHGKLVAMEALIRWQHPKRGLLAPAMFMQAVEDSDLAISVGGWVLKTACAQAKAWLDAGHGPISVSVNISARQFAHHELVASVACALEESGLPSSCLTLELTEGIVMRGAEMFIAKLNSLKSLGVRLSLDDFGTGYSSLSYLKRFPLDQLKIDQSFVRELVTNPDDASIVRAVISIAHSMGLDVIAEGVETEAQLLWLRRHRCEKMQGYFFSRPLDVQAFSDLLASGRDLSPVLAEKDCVERTLLIVDDEKNIVSSVARLLRADGYRILTANSAAEAYQVLAKNSVQVVISDHRMPVMTGADFLNSLRKLYPDTVRILFSGQVEVEALTNAINCGEVYRFLLKPWSDAVLKKSVRDAFRYHWLTHRQGDHEDEPLGVAV